MRKHDQGGTWFCDGEEDDTQTMVADEEDAADSATAAARSRFLTAYHESVSSGAKENDFAIAETVLPARILAAMSPYVTTLA